MVCLYIYASDFKIKITYLQSVLIVLNTIDIKFSAHDTFLE
jgi:hypothetical protein